MILLNGNSLFNVSQITSVGNMKINLDDLISHSFVISCDIAKLHTFYNRFHDWSCGRLTCQPYAFPGMIVKSGYYGGLGMWSNRPHQVGCGLSHYSIVNMARALGWPYVCIFEDDACPELQPEDAFTKLSQVLTNVPETTSVLKLGYDYRWGSSKPVTEVIVYGGHTWGSHAYIVFSSYYDAFLETYEAGDYLADITVINDEHTGSPWLEGYPLRKNIFRTQENIFKQWPAQEPDKFNCTPELNTGKVHYPEVIMMDDGTHLYKNRLPGVIHRHNFNLEETARSGDFYIKSYSGEIWVTLMGMIRAAMALNWDRINVLCYTVPGAVDVLRSQSNPDVSTMITTNEHGAIPRKFIGVSISHLHYERVLNTANENISSYRLAYDLLKDLTDREKHLHIIEEQNLRNFCQ